MKNAEEIRKLSKELRAMENKLLKESDDLNYKALITRTEANVYHTVALKNNNNFIDAKVDRTEWVRAFQQYFRNLGYKVSRYYETTYRISW